jgi:hypothetical protein
MSRADCIPCEADCAGLACSCACHRTVFLPGPIVQRAAPPRTISLEEARAVAVSQLVAAAREVLGAKGPTRKLAETKVHDVLAKLDVLGIR